MVCSLSFGVCLADKTNFEVRKFENYNGIYAEEIGTMKITEKSWHIATYIDLDNLYKNSRIAKNMITEYSKICTANGFDDYLEHEESINMNRKMTEIEDQINEILHMLGKRKEILRFFKVCR